MYKLYKGFSESFSSSHKFSTNTIFSSINSVVNFNRKYSIELYLNDIDQLMTVKSLKEEITQKITKILCNKNYRTCIEK